MTPIQQAIIIITQHIPISVISSNKDTATIAFFGAMEIDTNDLAQLIKDGIITLGHKTGRIKVVAQPEHQIVNN